MNAIAVHTKSSPCEQTPALSLLARVSRRSRRTYATALATLAREAGLKGDPLSIPWHRLSYVQAGAIRAAVLERHSPAYASLMLSAFRGVVREAWRMGLVGVEDASRLRDLPPVRGHREPRGRMLDPEASQALLATSEEAGGAAGARDRAILGLLLRQGLRRDEAASLDLADYDAEALTLLVTHGKGSKERLLPVARETAEVLAAWLEFRGSEAGPLLCAVDRHGHVARGRRLTAQAIYMAVRRLAERAGIGEVRPHDLRRTFASRAAERGDVLSLSRLLGHSDPKTTARYDLRPLTDQRSVVDGLFPQPQVEAVGACSE